MIQADAFVAAAAARGVGLWTGVPCSYLRPFINHVITDPDVRYVAAANEGDAIAVAAGAYLGGTTGLVMFQNSGLGNAVNPLTSLVLTHQIPMLLIVTLRADPSGRPDEPQHTLMGRITPQLLELMGVPWEYFPTEGNAIDDALDRAIEHLASARTPYAFVMREGSVAPVEAPPRGSLDVRQLSSALSAPDGAHTKSDGSRLDSALMTRAEALGVLQELDGPRDVIIATTGFTGRELYALEDRAKQFYLVGAMGCASSVGLGLSLVRPDVHVVVVDGDGAALMRLGALATIGAYEPRNLTHVLLDNGLHESTGGQETISSTVDFTTIAAACGYREPVSCHTPAHFRLALDRTGLGRNHRAGPHFIHVAIEPGVMPDLPRPARGPIDVAVTFRGHVAGIEDDGGVAS